MFSLIKFIDKTRLFTVELPSGLLSLFITESFLKLGSFTLELVSFMTGWIVLGYLLHSISKWLK